MSSSEGLLCLRTAENKTAAMLNVTAVNRTSTSSENFDAKIVVPLYVAIFVLSMIGNSMVLITLIQNKRMRTVTNVYLVNLAIADLLLGVFCMPFTLIGQLLRNFIFGIIMCKFIAYSQVVSISVSVWTLVAISLERYFAICSPLKSRRWQTQFHAYKMISCVWITSLLWGCPLLWTYALQPTRLKDTFRCREEWPSTSSERAYNLFLSGIMFLVPLGMMSLSYSLIVNKLWKGLQREIDTVRPVSRGTMEMKDLCGKNNNRVLNGGGSFRSTKFLQTNVKLVQDGKRNKSSTKTKAITTWIGRKVNFRSRARSYSKYNKTKTTLVTRSETLYSMPVDQSVLTTHSSDDGSMENTVVFKRFAIRSNYMDKSIEAKKKVIRMLFVIVLEFFLCWTPLHILNTVHLYAPEALYKTIGPMGISLIQLLAYINSCCNPITYCFMNRKFRQAFYVIFCAKGFSFCSKRTREKKTALINNGKIKIVNNSDVSINESTIYPGRASTLGRSEVVVLEGEDRV
ncbi:PREDICTED: cholecystokinin receptor-like [Nicrophorus vespilloides]|uniref:Gastrin/cholecystokinin type B receptor n=1 Tax=Nicrophorus vespilloides TaxID=110193 RepID=A0ABM1MFA0_NICVS|nr:PREDICTED: cholecystokinin receptor-like [Nicrophorus vespilloides]